MQARSGSSAPGAGARAGHVPRRPARALAALLGLGTLVAAVALPALPAAAEPPVPARVGATGALELAWPDGDRTVVALAPGATIDRVVELDEGWVAAGTESRRALVLLGADGAGGAVEPFPSPAVGGPRAAHPVPLAVGGRLAGLAWLAGDDERSLAVRFAPARVDAAGALAWGAAEIVSPPGPGTQTALAGTTLADGSLLLAWSAFDGQDDEILWSRRGADGWSAPEQLSAPNEVPDVTPVVAAVGGPAASDPAATTAIAAWSRYEEGEYRTVIATFRDGSWSAPAPAGPPGSISPELRVTDDASLLLYRDVRRRDWVAVEVDTDGRLGARARLAGPAEAPPAVVAADASGVTYVAAPGAEARTAAWLRNLPADR